MKPLLAPLRKKVRINKVLLHDLIKAEIIRILSEKCARLNSNIQNPNVSCEPVGQGGGRGFGQAAEKAAEAAGVRCPNIRLLTSITKFKKKNNYL